MYLHACVYDFMYVCICIPVHRQVWACITCMGCGNKGVSTCIRVIVFGRENIT